MKHARLDQKDHVILNALKKDGRTTVAELSHALGIPRATVHERITKLKRSGVIRKFTIEPDYERTGMPAVVFVFVSCEKPRQLARKLAGMEGVLGTYLISGDWDILLRIRGKSIEEIGMRMIEEIRKTPGVLRTRTVPCFDVLSDGP